MKATVQRHGPQAGGYSFTLLTKDAEEASGKLYGLTEKDLLDVTIKRHSEKRSLDANSYYWVLVGKLANAMHTSRPYMHNHLLIKYGSVQEVGGRCVEITMVDTDEYMEDTILHVYPTDRMKKNGEVWLRIFLLIKGSHEYNSDEMSKLIDGTVDDCKALGIETLTPDEIAEMVQKWGIKYG